MKLKIEIIDEVQEKANRSTEYMVRELAAAGYVPGTIVRALKRILEIMTKPEREK